MNIQAANIAPKAEVESTNSKKVILKNTSTQDGSVAEKEYEQNGLSADDNISEQPQSSSDELAEDENVLLAESQVIANEKIHPLLSGSLQYQRVEQTLGANSITPKVVSDEQLTGDDVVTGIEHARYFKDAQLLDSSVQDKTNAQTALLAGQTSAIDLNVNKRGLLNMPVARQVQTRSLERLTQPLNSSIINKADAVTINGDNITISKNELIKSAISNAQSAINLEHRDLQTLKSPLLSPFSSTEQSVDTFEWRQEKLKGSSSEWGQRLLSVLGDKVNLQIGQQVQRAQIRLDPPNLGSIEISIDVDGDKTSVSLVASNSQVRDAISQTLEQLRQTLMQNGSVSIDLNLSDKQQSNQHNKDEPIAGNNTLADNGEAEVSEKQESSSDWLNRLV